MQRLGSVRDNRAWYWLYLQRRRKRRAAGGDGDADVEAFAIFTAPTGVQKAGSIQAEVGDAVAFWRDQTANHRDVTMTNADQTLNLEGGVYSVAFASGGPHLATIGSAALQRTIVLKVKSAGGAFGDHVPVLFGVYFGLCVRAFDGALGIYGANGPQFSETLPLEGFYVIAITYDEGDAVLRVNGEEVLSVNVGSETGDINPPQLWLMNQIGNTFEIAHAEFYESLLPIETIQEKEATLGIQESESFTNAQGSEFTDSLGNPFTT